MQLWHNKRPPTESQTKKHSHTTHPVSFLTQKISPPIHVIQTEQKISEISGIVRSDPTLELRRR